MGEDRQTPQTRDAKLQARAPVKVMIIGGLIVGILSAIFGSEYTRWRDKTESGNTVTVKNGDSKVEESVITSDGTVSIDSVNTADAVTDILIPEDVPKYYTDGFDNYLPVLSPRLTSARCLASLPIFSGPGEEYWHDESLWTSIAMSIDLCVYGYTDEWIFVDAHSIYDFYTHTGWVKRSAISDSQMFELEEIKLGLVQMVTTQTTFCTDTPRTGDNILMTLPADYKVNALAIYLDDWVYCELTVDDDIPMRTFIKRDKLKLTN